MRPPPRLDAADNNWSNTPHGRLAPRTAPRPRYHTSYKQSSSSDSGAALQTAVQRRACRCRAGASCAPPDTWNSGWVRGCDPDLRMLGAPPRKRRIARRNRDRSELGRQLVAWSRPSSPLGSACRLQWRGMGLGPLTSADPTCSARARAVRQVHRPANGPHRYHRTLDPMGALSERTRHWTLIPAFLAGPSTRVFADERAIVPSPCGDPITDDVHH